MQVLTLISSSFTLCAFLYTMGYIATDEFNALLTVYRRDVISYYALPTGYTLHFFTLLRFTVSTCFGHYLPETCRDFEPQ
jgi:hypothetical protein